MKSVSGCVRDGVVECAALGHVLIVNGVALSAHWTVL